MRILAGHRNNVRIRRRPLSSPPVRGLMRLQSQMKLDSVQRRC